MSQFNGILSLSENIDLLDVKDQASKGGSSLFKSDSVATYQTNQLVLVDRVNPLKTRTIANCKIAFLVNLSHAHGKR
jgi:uncharacterized protein YccT (UPF0319 family)